MNKTRRVRVIHKDYKLRARIRRAVLRNNLDRRFAYSATPDGYLAKVGRYTDRCSGCIAMDGSNLGCKECGYTGKRVVMYLERFSYFHITMTQAGDTDGC
jgi:hypothetical protein